MGRGPVVTAPRPVVVVSGRCASSGPALEVSNAKCQWGGRASGAARCPPVHGSTAQGPASGLAGIKIRELGDRNGRLKKRSIDGVLALRARATPPHLRSVVSRSRSRRRDERMKENDTETFPASERQYRPGVSPRGGRRSIDGRHWQRLRATRHAPSGRGVHFEAFGTRAAVERSTWSHCMILVCQRVPPCSCWLTPVRW